MRTTPTTPPLSQRDVTCVFYRCAEMVEGTAHSLFCPRHDPETCVTCSDIERARREVAARDARDNQRSGA